MASEPTAERFEFAFGQGSVQEGDLLLDRTDPEEVGRLGVFRRGLAANAAQRPWKTRLGLIVGLLLGLVFVGLLGILYASNPALTPLLVLLAGLFALAVLGPLEWNYRRSSAVRERQRAALSEEFDLVRPERIPLQDIVRVTERQVATPRGFPDGEFLLVHFETGDGTATTALGFPAMMDSEKARARTMLEELGIPIGEAD